MKALAYEDPVEAHGVHAQGPWPRGVSRKPYMTIGKLVEKIRHEFPALSVSKVRYFEQQNLVTPMRDSSGYRRYSNADLERLRFCLIQQRDHYLPISKIEDKLRILDSGEEEAPLEPIARVVASDGKLMAPVNKPVTVRELEDLTGVNQELLEKLVDCSIIKPDLAGRFSPRCISIVSLAMVLEREGLSPRLLTFIRLTAEREADLIDHACGSISHARGVEKERRMEKAEATGSLLSQLHTELLRLALENLR